MIEKKPRTTRAQYAEPPRAMSVPECAKYLGVGTSTIYKLIADEALKSFLIGRARRITRDQLDAYINRRIEAA